MRDQISQRPVYFRVTPATVIKLKDADGTTAALQPNALISVRLGTTPRSRATANQIDVIALPGAGGAITLDTVAALVEYNAERRGIVQSFTVLAAESVIEDHPAKDFFTERYGSSRAWMAEVIRAELGDELPAGLTPEQAAPLLFAVMDGLQLQWLLAPDEIDMPGLFRAFLALLRVQPLTPE